MKCYTFYPILFSVFLSLNHSKTASPWKHCFFHLKFKVCSLISLERPQSCFLYAKCFPPSAESPLQALWECDLFPSTASLRFWQQGLYLYLCTFTNQSWKVLKFFGVPSSENLWPKPSTAQLTKQAFETWNVTFLGERSLCLCVRLRDTD